MKEESVARICGMGRKGENVVTIIVIENGNKKDKWDAWIVFEFFSVN